MALILVWVIIHFNITPLCLHTRVYYYRNCRRLSSDSFIIYLSFFLFDAMQWDAQCSAAFKTFRLAAVVGPHSSIAFRPFHSQSFSLIITPCRWDCLLISRTTFHFWCISEFIISGMQFGNDIQLWPSVPVLDHTPIDQMLIGYLSNWIYY